MNDVEQIRQAVYQALETLNETLDDHEQLAVDDATDLSGLDSLGVTNLIVAAEDAADEVLGVELSLTDDDTLAAIMSKDTPLRTVGSFVEFVANCLGRRAE